jgi:hypothetical protein
MEDFRSLLLRLCGTTRARKRRIAIGRVASEFSVCSSNSLAKPLSAEPAADIESELVAVLFQDNTHQLTARSDTSLGKELLKCGFDRTL